MLGVGLGIVVLLAGCGGGSAGPQTSPTPTPSTSTSATAPASTASQSPADAARDGVIKQLAAIPFADRVHILKSVSTPEGVWALSRPPASIKSYTVGCRLGPEAGKYPKQTICTSDYGELLLLDPSATRIIRAYPLPAVPPTYLVVTKSTVFCGRDGDRKLSETALPDSMVCSVDRKTLQARVHVFAPGLTSECLQPCFFPPKNWTVTNGRIDVTGLEPAGNGLRVLGRHGASTLLDPKTLKVLAH